MLESAQTLTVKSIAILLFKRTLFSLVCASVSWIFMLLLVYVQYSNHPDTGWFPLWWCIGVYSSLAYLNIFLVLFLPLFLLIRPRNHFWSIYINPLVLGSVGWAIAKFGFSSHFVDKLLEDVCLPVAIASAATGLSYAIVQRWVVKRAQKQRFLASAI